MQYRKGGILKLAFTEADKSALRSMISQPTVQWLEAEDVRKSEKRYRTQFTRCGIYRGRCECSAYCGLPIFCEKC